MDPAHLEDSSFFASLDQEDPHSMKEKPPDLNPFLTIDMGVLSEGPLLFQDDLKLEQGKGVKLSQQKSHSKMKFENMLHSHLLGLHSPLPPDTPDPSRFLPPQLVSTPLPADIPPTIGKPRFPPSGLPLATAPPLSSAPSPRSRRSSSHSIPASTSRSPPIPPSPPISPIPSLSPTLSPLAPSPLSCRAAKYTEAEIRRQKHNQAEKRRRNKIKETFKELASLVECGRTQKSTILRVTIDKVQSLQQRVKSLKLENEELKRHASVTPPMDSSAHHHHGVTSDKFVKQEMKFSKPRQDSNGTSSALSFSASPHSQFFYHSSVAILISNLSGKIVDCNHVFALLLGYPREALLRAETTTFQITHPDSLATTFVLVSTLLTNPGRTQRMKKKYITKSGSTLIVEMTSWISCNTKGQPELIHSIVEPIEEVDELDLST